jgi:hypothetical protein
VVFLQIRAFMDFFKIYYTKVLKTISTLAAKVVTPLLI